MGEGSLLVHIAVRTTTLAQLQKCWQNQFGTTHTCLLMLWRQGLVVAPHDMGSVSNNVLEGGQNVPQALALVDIIHVSCVGACLVTLQAQTGPLQQAMSCKVQPTPKWMSAQCQQGCATFKNRMCSNSLLHTVVPACHSSQTTAAAEAPPQSETWSVWGSSPAPKTNIGQKHD